MVLWHHSYIEIKWSSLYLNYNFRYTALTTLGIKEEAEQIMANVFYFCHVFNVFLIFFLERFFLIFFYIYASCQRITFTYLFSRTGSGTVFFFLFISVEDGYGCCNFILNNRR